MRKRLFGWMAMSVALGVGLQALAQGSGTMGPMAMGHEAKAAVRSTSLSLQAGEKTMTLSATDLQAMPHETVSVMNGHSRRTKRIAGCRWRRF